MVEDEIRFVIGVERKANVDDEPYVMFSSYASAQALKSLENLSA